MTTEDYEYVAVDMADKLRAGLVESSLLANRTGDTPPMVIAISKVTNLTSDLMSEGAKWYLMERVKSALPLSTLSRDKNIVFVIPAEHLRDAHRRGTVESDFAAERKPSHAMTATFTSVTRATGKDRTDLYYCEYTITDLKSGEMVWTDKVEFKRVAHGRAWD